MREKDARFVPVFEELPLLDGDSPLDLFSGLANDRLIPGAFYLQRALLGDRSHQPAETILAFDPFETIRIRHGQARIYNRFQKSGAPITVQGDPFSIVAKRIQEYHAIGSPGHPFFQGGALGYFAYDSVRFLEPALIREPGNLKALSDGDAPSYDAEVMLFSKQIVFDHLGGRILLMSGLMPEHEKSEEGIKRVRAEIQVLKESIQEYRAGSKSRRKTKGGRAKAGRRIREFPIQKMTSMLGKRRYLDGVKKLKEHIKAGDIFQAVLSDKLTVPYEGEPLALFKALSQASPAPYQFYFDSGEGVYMGASPEMLLKVRGRELETHPIAGTRPRGKTAAAERKLEAQLLRSEKECAEHLMLVDLARNDVGRVSDPGTVRVDEYMKIKKFSGVMHLVSRVTGQLKRGTDALAALASCFPAGTLSGAPKIRAMQLLSSLEPEPRGFYGGAVVAASFTGDLDSCISIRSIQLDGAHATIQVGAGIVADSQPAREYDEITQKSRGTRTALATAISGEGP